MQTLESGYRGIRLLVNLNGDRLLFIGTLTGALWLGAFFAAL